MWPNNCRLRKENAVNDNKKSDKVEVFEDEKDLLLDHDYDGIQELDHPLPRWWLATFYITIVFSVFYVGYYMTGIGPTLGEELAVALAEIEAKRPAAPEGGIGDDIIQASLADPNKLKNGEGVYIGKCAACHGDKGQGLIGPNLTDTYWMHGKGTSQDIAKAIADGIPEKGMPPWGAILTPDELVNVTAFIHSIKGTNPPGAKEPQGEAYEL